MSGEPTGVLEVVEYGGEERTYTWNGDADDRRAARAAFDRMAKAGGFLATVEEAPGRARQVRTFDEIEETEHALGTVTARVSPQVVGG